MPRFEPDVFGKYFLLQRIGIGGMAEVIRAKTVGAGGFQKELVIKRVLPRFAKDASFVRMFVNEAKITVGLAHPNIAQVLELGEIGGTYFMAIELIDGVDLANIAPLFRGDTPTLTIDDAVWLMFEALKGLDYAHRRTDPLGQHLGIVHCDISPDNLMVTFDAAVKILDFGIARVATSLSNRRKGMVMGKMNYLSPEQALGKEVDPRSDIYAAGVVLYHLVTGDFPYGRFDSLEALTPIVTGAAKYVPAVQHNPRVPEELDAVLRKAVELNPKKRFPDARFFLMALEEVLYPTSHSAIAEHVRMKVGQSFTERKDRLSRLRANDDAVMRILARRAQDAPPSEKPDTGETSVVTPPPFEQTPSLHRGAKTSGTDLKRRHLERPWWHVSIPQVVVALIMAVILAGGYEFVRTQFFARGVLVLESEPTGARVFLDGSLMPGVTPNIVEDFRTSRAYGIRMELDDHDGWTGNTPGDGSQVQRVRAELVRRYGPVRVVSVPQGAEVFINDESVGQAPLDIERFNLVGPTKISLERPGFERHEQVLRDIEAGQELIYELERRRRR